MYRYYISYVYQGPNGYGFASCESVLTGKITGTKDINDIAESIQKESGYDSVVIMGFTLFA